MGLLFPAFRGAQDQAKKVQAKSDVAQIVSAVNAYFTDYGTYPLNSNQVGGGGAGFDTVYGDPNGSYTSADLFDILRAVADGNYNQNNQLNAKQVVYFNGPNAKDTKNPRGGFFIGTSSITNANGYTIKPGSYVDPWGDEYVTFIDADYNGEITQALSWFYSSEYQYPSGPVHVRFGVAGSSLGKDGKWGTSGDGKVTGSDDVPSWQ